MGMNLKSENHMNLFFPQWQGSGPSNVLFHGAGAVRDCFGDLEFTEVPVPESQELAVSNGILGYESIVGQLASAGQMIQARSPGSIFTIGGDCGVEPAPVSWLNRYYDGDLAVVWFDAHGDLNTPASSPSKHFHGMPLRALLGEGDPVVLDRCFSRISPDRVVMAGLRELDWPELEFLGRHPVVVKEVAELTSDSGSLVEAVREKGVGHVYIHIDLDVLEPRMFPHIKHPTANGLSPEALLDLLSGLAAEFRIAGCSILEYLPGEFPGAAGNGLPLLREILGRLGG